MSAEAQTFRDSTCPDTDHADVMVSMFDEVWLTVTEGSENSESMVMLRPDTARQLAAALLNAAREAEGR